jgi:5-methyltetrahydropteroyltriglutamate--homocysteine methyltransferase
MKGSTDRILTTHAGSLPRPPELLALLHQRDTRQPYDADALAALVRSAVRDVVRKQVEAGIDIISDGEMSKPGFYAYVRDRLTGFEGESRARVVWGEDRDFPEWAAQKAAAGGGGWVRPACTGPIAWKDKSAVTQDIEHFKAALETVSAEEAFIPAVSPGTVAHTMNNEYYPSEEAYLYAAAAALKEEYHAIVDAGFLLQIDSPDLAMGRQTQFPDATLDEFRKVNELRIEVLNWALSDIPAERVRHHICWGNYEGPHHRDVELKDIVDIVLQSRVGAIYVESANPRHEHEWKVWQEVRLPDGMLLIAGVIDTKTNIIEHPELVAERIQRFASAVGRENVIAATDCGFGTTADRTRVHPSIVWAKLRTLADGARLASSQLWSR